MKKISTDETSCLICMHGMNSHRINMRADGKHILYNIVCCGDNPFSKGSDCGCNADFKEVRYHITKVES